MDEPAAFDVEVVYALPDRSDAVTVRMTAGSSVEDAIRLSGLPAAHPEICAVPMAAGIYGRRVSLSAVPQNGDRIEIYRPLVADPKQLRLKRARSRGKAAP
jgi:putative ubiquitin-RnfH superfamily antitoxin RatB of RatAB toxin-antitoxin module